MLFHYGRVFLLLTVLFISISAKAQSVWYPRNSSELLKSTAADISQNLSQATGSSFAVGEYQQLPASGIIFIYDSSITANDACRIESDGITYLKFIARQDNGLNIGVYKYLAELGFRFYLPGTIWEKIPSLGSPYKLLNKTVQVGWKYNTWFISGGASKWAMDNDDTYSWDVYHGKNGHDWALYQRRNAMTGAYRFAGHRGDIYTPDFIQKLTIDPCLVASFNGERIANVQSVPDINNASAKDLWANEIRKKHESYSSTINSNPAIYPSLYRNFEFANTMLGVEVADGARWGNSAGTANCSAGNWNGQPYPSESEQQFLLANNSAEKIGTTMPGKSFQCYAYDGHANVPSSSIAINNAIDVQVVSTAFQLESSSKGLLKRWYSRHSNISEYHYFNIPQWGGETPLSSSTELSQTIKRIKNENAQGIVIEASPAKFASLPQLYSANRLLQENKSMDSSLAEFVNAMFSPAAASHISKLFSYWGNEQVNTVGNYIQDNKFKLPLYFQLVKKASDAAVYENAPAIVMQRLGELKAYLHYMSLYYDWFADNNSYINKAAKADRLCLYLARIADLKIVNSYYLIQDMLYRFPVSHELWQKFDIQNGTSYLGGQLQKITAAEIESDFNSDQNYYVPLVPQYDIKSLQEIVSKFQNSDLETLKKIDVKIAYTNGKDYPNRTELFIYAPAAGSFDITCTPTFNMPGKGFINITAEAVDDPLKILKDVTITRDYQPGKINVVIPASGFYKLTILSKYQTSNQLSIETKGNLFFRNGPFYGNMVENYRLDLVSLPKYFYVPAGVSKLYFSSNNVCPSNRNCFTAADMQSAFSIKDHEGNRVTVDATNDPSLFSINTNSIEGFWQVSIMREFNLCFANISNVEFYAARKKCTTADFSIKLMQTAGECFTRLSSFANPANLQWEIYDSNRWYYFSGTNTVNLPVLSPYAMVTLKNGPGCLYTVRTGVYPGYMENLVNCAVSGPLPDTRTNVFPNPSKGKFNFTVDGLPAAFDDLQVFDIHGRLVAHGVNISSIDLQELAPAVYFYRAKKNGVGFKGKLVRI